jgi:hypothetical protein
MHGLLRSFTPLASPCALRLRVNQSEGGISVFRRADEIAT